MPDGLSVSLDQAPRRIAKSEASLVPSNALTQPLQQDTVRVGSSENAIKSVSHAAPKLSEDRYRYLADISGLPRESVVAFTSYLASRNLVADTNFGNKDSERIRNFLSDRELEIFLQDRDGIPREEIALKFGVNKNAIRKTIGQVRSKLRNTQEFKHLGEFSKGLFSPREMEVLWLTAQGVGEKDIAVKLGLANATVHNLLGQARVKTDALSNSEAVTRAMDIGQLNPLEIIPVDFKIGKISTLTHEEKKMYAILLENGGFKTYEQIASELKITERVIKYHAKIIWEKLGLRNRNHALIVNHAVQLSELELLLSLEAGGAGGSGAVLRR